MNKEQLLDNVTHKNTRIINRYSAELGDNVSLANVFPSEFAALQSEYAIFFKKDTKTGQFQSVVLLGVEADKNLYLDAQGWNANHIPLSMQRQPFLIGFVEKQHNGIPIQEPAVYIDMSHPKVSETGGKSLFNEVGGTTPFLDNINQTLMRIHEGHEQSQQFLNYLLKLDLLESALLNVGEHKLSGLYTINEDMLARLDSHTLSLLHQQGYLQHIYMILASLGQLKTLIDKQRK